MFFKKIIWLFPFITFLFGYYLTGYFFETTEIQVPYLIGISLPNASKILSDSNLNLRILNYKEDSDLPDNTVIDQSPANQSIKINKPVYLIISKKPQNFKLPDFKNKNISEIQEILNKANIRSKNFYQQSNFQKDTCISQYPSPDKTLDKNEKVILYLSSGIKKPIIFPDFINLNLKEVLNFLNSNNLKANIITEDFEQYEPNKDYIIINQRPLSGSIINLNNNLKIDLLVK